MSNAFEDDKSLDERLKPVWTFLICLFLGVATAAAALIIWIIYVIGRLFW